MSKKQPKKMSPQQVQKIKQLHHEGHNAYQIGKMLSIPTGVCRYHIEREKLALLTHSSPVEFESSTKEDDSKFYIQTIKKLIDIIELH